MKDPLDRIMFVFYGLFGAGLGLLIFLIALGGLRYVVMGESTRPWNGAIALILCCVIGGGWGLVAYNAGDREFGSVGSDYYQDPATAALFVKRVMVVVSSLAGLYFVWQMARGV